MRLTRSLPAGIGVLLCSLSLQTCGRGERPAAAAAPAGGDVLAEMNGDTIRRAEVDRRAEGTLARLRQEEYETRKAILDQILEEKLLAREAADRGLPREALLREEVDAKSQPPTAAEVKTVWDQVAAQVQGRDPAEVRGQIERSLRERNREGRRAAYVKELRRKHGVRVALAAPRVELPIPSSAPALGGAKAPVTVVEYLDYQCPYCRRAQTIVDELLSRYKDKVRFVHRDFPIQGHPRALPAAQAARCAGEQGKFWDYHRAIFASPSSLADSDLRILAAGLGLKGDAFASCLASGRHDSDIQASLVSGQALGVDSTPTFFINGRRVTGARPVAQFEEIIDEELAKAGSS